MSGIYTVPFSAVAATVQQDLVEVTAASSKQLVVIGFGLSQNTEFGDAQEENLLILLKSGQTTTGSGGTTVTPGAADTSNGAAASFVAKANNTTKATAGTIITHYAWGWNERNTPWDIIFPEPMQILLVASRRCTLELATTPADSITLNGYMVCQEVG